MRQLKTVIEESFFDDVEDVISTDIEEKIILEFLKENYKVDLNKVSLRTEGSKIIVDVKGNVELRNLKMKNFTNGLFEFGVVTGYFDCYGSSGLTSLEGAPREVKYSFSCDGCKNLTSLEGGPEKVGAFFDCSHCANLISLEGAPRIINGFIDCYKCTNLTITPADRKKYQIKDKR